MSKQRGVLGIIYRDHDGLLEDRPFNDKNTLKAYTLFSEAAREVGLHAVLGKPEDYKGGKFASAWDLLGNKKLSDVSLDLAWDRNVTPGSESYFHEQVALIEEVEKSLPVANSSRLVRISEDKFVTATSFPKDVPQTLLGSKLKEARSIFLGRVVAKPRYGSHGHGVIIGDISELTDLNDDYIIQPFIDSSRGIPGIIEGVHDLRIGIMNGSIVDSYIRYPEKGLLSNVSYGGKMQLVEKKNIPQSVFESVKEVDALFANEVPRFYSVDFMFDGERPWIIELNKSPGIWGHVATGVPEVYIQRLCTNIARGFTDSLQALS